MCNKCSNFQQFAFQGTHPQTVTVVAWREGFFGMSCTLVVALYLGLDSTSIFCYNVLFYQNSEQVIDVVNSRLFTERCETYSRKQQSCNFKGKEDLSPMDLLEKSD